MTEKEKQDRSLINAGLAGAQAETVQRYGSAVKEHVVEYSGIDREAGEKLAKGLKGISKSKLNPNDRARNIKQQAGFSAEVKTKARENAEKTIAGDKTTKVTRTDDMVKQPDGKGRMVGGKNEQLYDIAETTVDGVYIKGTGRQLKYVGGDAKGCYKKLIEKKFDKYRDADVPIEIPSDFYDDVQQRLSDKIDSLEKQMCKAEASGNLELAENRRAQLEKIKKTKGTLKKGKLTNAEAIEARVHPIISTAKDVAKVSHRAGMESAKYGAIIGGGISIVQNLVALIRDEKAPDEAVMAVAIDTGSSAAISYGTGFVGASIKGFMQNAHSGTLQTLSKTNLPGIVVSVAVGAGKTMNRYLNGEINGVECFEELGEQGTGMVSSALFATIGQMAIPIPVVGGLIGGMLGYAIASASYGTLLTTLKDEKLAHENRIIIEQACQEHILLIRAYRLEVEQAISEYLTSNMEIFHNSFDSIKSSLAIGDIDGFITGANAISEALGREVQFRSLSEFDALMNSDQNFRL